jgi:ribonuclease HII
MRCIILPDNILSFFKIQSHTRMIAGVDEAGVGSLMSIMVAGAVILPDEFDVSNLCDSKKSTDKKRKLMSDKLMREADVGIGIVTEDEIDSLGLAKCRRLVFHRALDNLKSKDLNKIIVDGTLFEQYNDVAHECIPKADATVPCVSAASIVAKHYRDTFILGLCDDNIELSNIYGWRTNKGYPSQKHREAIKANGISKFHRKSYAPCSNQGSIDI